MSGPIEVVAILTPAPGKIDELIEALSTLNKHVEDNEKDVLRYEMFKQTNGGTEAVVYIELYKNMEAFDAHKSSEVFALANKEGAEKQLLGAAPDIKVLQRIGGFASR